MTALPLIDARRARLSLDELQQPVETTRENARAAGELWGVVVLRAVGPFLSANVECVTALVMHATDDAKLGEFARIAQEQSVSKSVQTFEVVGPRKDVGPEVFKLAGSMGPSVGEITVRWIDDFMP